jgi:hypothetical protein
VGANYADSNAAVVWWTALTTGGYALQFEKFTDNILNVTTSTPAITLSGSVSSILSVNAPGQALTSWSLQSTSTGFVVAYTTSPTDHSTESLYVQSFDTNGNPLTPVEPVLLNEPSNELISPGVGSQEYLYWSEVNGAQTGFYGETFDPTTGALGSSPIQIISDAAFTQIFQSSGSTYLSNGDDVNFTDGMLNGQHVIQVAELGPNLSFIGVTDTLSLSGTTGEGFALASVYDPDTNSQDYTALAYLDANKLHLVLFDDNGEQIGSDFVVPGATSLLRLHDIGGGSQIEVDYTVPDGHGGQNVVGAIYDTAAAPDGNLKINDGSSDVGLWSGTPYNDTIAWGSGVNIVDGGGGTDTFIATSDASVQLSVATDGQGDVVLSDGSGNVDTLEKFSVLELPGGTIGVNGGALTQTSGALTLTGGLTLNEGSYSLNGGALAASSINLAASASFVGSGAIVASFTNAGSVEATGDLSLSGAVAGSGHFQIDNSAALEFNGPVSGGTVTFASGAGVLQLDDPSQFEAQIAGITGSGDILFFQGISASGTIASSAGSFNGTTTTLTVNAGNDVTFKITLDGDYSGSTWTVGEDPSHTGVDIVDPPARLADGSDPAASQSAVGKEIVARLNGEDNFVFKASMADDEAIKDHVDSAANLAEFHNLRAFHFADHQADMLADDMVAADDHTPTLSGVHTHDLHPHLFSL